ncbi:hypothetical protein HRbin30_00098 [bacterium HR30]|nr:hypothetical protein HRbin30_00098 [bacterium HR30]
MAVPAKLEVPSPRRRLWIRRTALVLLPVSNTAQPWPTAGLSPVCASGSASWRPRTSIENFYPRAGTRHRSLFLRPLPAISTHPFTSARFLGHERCRTSQQSRPPLQPQAKSRKRFGSLRWKSRRCSRFPVTGKRCSPAVATQAVLGSLRTGTTVPCNGSQCNHARCGSVPASRPATFAAATATPCSPFAHPEALVCS